MSVPYTQTYLTRWLKDGIMERKGAAILRQRDSQYVSVATDTERNNRGLCVFYATIARERRGKESSPVNCCCLSPTQ
jgi:hypothetical protein